MSSPTKNTNLGGRVPSSIFLGEDRNAREVYSGEVSEPVSCFIHKTPCPRCLTFDLAPACLSLDIEILHSLNALEIPSFTTIELMVSSVKMLPLLDFSKDLLV